VPIWMDCGSAEVASGLWSGLGLGIGLQLVIGLRKVKLINYSATRCDICTLLFTHHRMHLLLIWTIQLTLLSMRLDIS